MPSVFKIIKMLNLVGEVSCYDGISMVLKTSNRIIHVLFFAYSFSIWREVAKFESTYDGTFSIPVRRSDRADYHISPIEGRIYERITYFYPKRSREEIDNFVLKKILENL